MSEEQKQPSQLATNCPACGVRVVYAQSDKVVRCPSCAMTIATPSWRLDVSGDRAEEVKDVARTVAADMANRGAPGRTPWLSGSFYLAAIVVLVALFLVVAQIASPWLFPLVVIAGILALSVVGALQLRQDSNLSETSFIKLMALALRQLPLIRRDSGRKQ